MNSLILHLTRLFFCIIPETRLFGFKVHVLRMAGCCLGKNVRICSSVTILGSGCLEVGDDTWIGHQALICSSSRITIGKEVDIDPRVYIGTGTHEIDSEQSRSAGVGVSKDVVIENGVWLGVGCIVLSGVTIGEKSVIAAGAVVTKSIPPHVVVGGIPARLIRVL